VKRLLLLLLSAMPIGCSSTQPFATTVGIMKPGTTMVVRITDARLDAYQPEARQRRDLFTVTATALRKSTPDAPRLRATPRGVIVDARAPLVSLLVRVPDRVNLAVESRHGDVNVTDIPGNARVVALAGNVNLMLPGYAQAAVGTGNLSVTMGSTNWPGTLHFQRSAATSCCASSVRPPSTCAFIPMTARSSQTSVCAGRRRGDPRRLTVRSTEAALSPSTLRRAQVRSGCCAYNPSRERVSSASRALISRTIASL